MPSRLSLRSAGPENMREITGTVILMIIAVIVSVWIIIDQGQYIRQQDQEIRELYARINNLEFCLGMQAAYNEPFTEEEGDFNNSPYVVNGERYIPMSVKEAETYSEQGIASYYGFESGHITATGEAFDPEGISAAHKYLPLPTYVRVTNLENKKSIIIRVNDRGPFIPDRIIDLSEGAAKKLGIYKQGTAQVLVETIKEG
jgi:rare lipoprotein A (peptidoglycan hydrolase)